MRRAATSEKLAESCATAISPRILTEVYGSRLACREENKPDPGDRSVDTAAISATRVDGDKATTRLKYGVDGATIATGRVALVKQDGDEEIASISGSSLAPSLERKISRAVLSC